MNSRVEASIAYDVAIRIGGLGLLALTGNGRSLHDRLVGPSVTDWGANKIQLEPWAELRPSSTAGLLGEVGAWGQPIDVPGQDDLFGGEPPSWK